MRGLELFRIPQEAGRSRSKQWPGRRGVLVLFGRGRLALAPACGELRVRTPLAVLLSRGGRAATGTIESSSAAATAVGGDVDFGLSRSCRRREAATTPAFRNPQAAHVDCAAESERTENGKGSRDRSPDP